MIPYGTRVPVAVRHVANCYTRFLTTIALLRQAVCDWSGNDDVDSDGGQFNQSRPSFKPTPSNVSVSLGQTAVLQCSVDNLGDRTVSLTIYTVSQKNNTDVAHYNYDVHEGILIIFSRYVLRREGGSGPPSLFGVGTDPHFSSLSIQKFCLQEE